MATEEYKAIVNDIWKSLKAEQVKHYFLVDSRDSVQVYATQKIDISSKVQLREDIRREIAHSKTKPVEPARDPMPYVMAMASFGCSMSGVFDGHEMLSSPAIKMYTYAYIILMVLFQELSMHR